MHHSQTIEACGTLSRVFAICLSNRLMSNLSATKRKASVRSGVNSFLALIDLSLEFFHPVLYGLWHICFHMWDWVSPFRPSIRPSVRPSGTHLFTIPGNRLLVVSKRWNKTERLWEICAVWNWIFHFTWSICSYTKGAEECPIWLPQNWESHFRPVFRLLSKGNVMN